MVGENWNAFTKKKQVLVKKHISGIMYENKRGGGMAILKAHLNIQNYLPYSSCSWAKCFTISCFNVSDSSYQSLVRSVENSYKINKQKY